MKAGGDGPVQIGALVPRDKPESGGFTRQHQYRIPDGDALAQATHNERVVEWIAQQHADGRADVHADQRSGDGRWLSFFGESEDGERWPVLAENVPGGWRYGQTQDKRIAFHPASWP